MIYLANSGGYNTFSIQKVIERVGGKSEITSNPETLLKADKVLIPGVGHAKHAMDKINKLEIAEALTQRTRPTLGVCVGMQLMFSHSEEGDVELLNIFPERVQHLPKSLRAPHMGWNSLAIQNSSSKLLKGIENGEFAYFVHSYYVENNKNTSAYCEYEDLKITAAIECDNFFATQFHPEKSASVGEKIMKNFLEMS
ncbi:MAG: imidazole glycerol phosphate synthase subunit HisH [Bdellovibrionales bacterium]|nr:imidazole glycerol phosphate synthase subunit HisH [Bdellovibrionales bacterium]